MQPERVVCFSVGQGCDNQWWRGQATINLKAAARPTAPALRADERGAEFLEASLRGPGFGCIGFYNRATGLTFATRDDEDQFVLRAGLGSAAPAPPGAPVSRLPQEPTHFFPAADKALRYGASEEDAAANPELRKPVALVIEYAETLFPNAPALSPEERNALIF